MLAANKWSITATGHCCQLSVVSLQPRQSLPLSNCAHLLPEGVELLGQRLQLRVTLAQRPLQLSNLWQYEQDRESALKTLCCGWVARPRGPVDASNAGRRSARLQPAAHLARQTLLPGARRSLVTLPCRSCLRLECHVCGLHRGRNRQVSSSTVAPSGVRRVGSPPNKCGDSTSEEAPASTAGTCTCSVDSWA